MFRAWGHTVVMVTQRGPEHSSELVEATGGNILIVFAGGKTKREAALEEGYDVDVWIDDEPIGVYTARTYIGPVKRRL